MLEASYQGPERLSYSATSKWAQCPRKAWRHYALRDREPTQQHLVLGVAIHRIAELAVEQKAFGDVERMRALCKHVFESETSQSEEWAQLPDINVLEFKRELWRQLANIAQAIHDGVFGTPRHVEFEINTLIAGVPYTGSIDLLWEYLRNQTSGLIVLDWKSGKPWDLSPRFDGSEPFAVKNLFQLLLYAIAVEQTLNEPIIGSMAVFTRENPVKVIKVGNDLRERAVQWLLDTYEVVKSCVEAQEAPPNPGPLCGWCGYLEHCPEGRKEVAVRINRRKNISEQHSEIAALPPYELQHWVETAEVTQIEALTVTEASIRECIELELKRPTPRKGRLAQYVEDLEKRFGVVYELDAKHKPKRRAKKAA